MRWMLTIPMLMLFSVLNVSAEEPQLERVNATIYCSGNTTADGSPIREGICAVAPDHIGQTVLIYTLDRELLGIWEAKDTGGQTIKDGHVIDVYFSSEDAGKEFIRKTYENDAHGKVLIQYVDADG